MNDTLHIEDQLKDALQRDVQFIVNNKALREGKLIMYNMKDFYISFILITKKDLTKTYDIPLPYKVFVEAKGITFDYRLAHVHHNSKTTKLLIESISKSIGKKSKLYDNILTIKYNA